MMLGVLYIIPVDPIDCGERFEIIKAPQLEELQKMVGGNIEIVPGFTSIECDDGVMHSCVAFCNEDGKNLGLPTNHIATAIWYDTLTRQDHDMAPFADYLVGNIVVIRGDEELMAEL